MCSNTVQKKYSTYLAFVLVKFLQTYTRSIKPDYSRKRSSFSISKGGVNKGMGNTIINEPEMFCAYNNGITVYAESIVCSNQ